MLDSAAGRRLRCVVIDRTSLPPRLMWRDRARRDEGSERQAAAIRRPERAAPVVSNWLAARHAIGAGPHCGYISTSRIRAVSVGAMLEPLVI